MKKIHIIFAVAALSLLTGCKGFLTEEPVMSQSDKLTFSTYDGLDKVTAGCYAYIASGTWYGGGFITLNEMKTMNGRKYLNTDFDTGRMRDAYNINYTKDKTSGLWGLAYQQINTLNNVLANLEGKGEPQDLNNLRAECLFMRALAHFDLVRTYGLPYSKEKAATNLGVPYLTTPQSSTDKPKRETVAVVYENVIKDLTEAADLIDPDYTREGAKDVRAVASIHAINALLSRVYLYKQDWENAALYATKVIESGEFTMWDVEDMKDAKCFAEDVRTPGEGEVIFEAYQGSGENGGDNEGICSLTSSEKYGDAGAGQELMDLYEKDDVRATLFHSKKCKSTGTEVFWTRKYIGKGIQKPDYSNVIILRLSEMYLNRAEAYKNMGLDSKANADLQVIAKYRGATAQPATTSGLRLERQKELAWEGHFWFDLGREHLDMVRSNYGQPTVIDKVDKDSHLWAMPIPDREHLVNENLVRNSGY